MKKRENTAESIGNAGKGEGHSSQLVSKSSGSYDDDGDVDEKGCVKKPIVMLKRVKNVNAMAVFQDESVSPRWPKLFVFPFSVCANC